MASGKKIHFSGIGGTAMVAGARLALEAGWEVRGSDNPLYPPTSDMVAALSVPVYSGYDAANLDWNPDVVVLGNALSRGNAEVEAALSRRMHFVSLPEWLKEHVLRDRRPIALCGTHGKTTTTALTAWILDHCDRRPGWLIGGQPIGVAHSARLGAAGAPFAIEGDEYDTAFFDKRAKFLHYVPEIAVVTSVEFDHGDIYRDLGEIDLAFQRMLRQIPREGWLLCCADNRAALLKDHAFSQVATYGFAEDADWRGISEVDAEGRRLLTIVREGKPFMQVRPSIAGRHNAQNILGAVAAAACMGADPEAIAAAVECFPGIKRRLEVFLEHRGVSFVDDFAHHPTAIRETLAGARERWPQARILVLFEPRSNTTVTRAFQEDLEKAFCAADVLWMGPIYRAERIPAEERLDRGVLAENLRRNHVEAAFEDDTKVLAQKVWADLRPGDVVLFMSNGAFGGIYDQFRRMAAEEA